MNDDANPRGMQRPRLARKKVYQDDPKTSSPIESVHSKAVRKSGRKAVGKDVHGNTYGASEGNDPKGMPRPELGGDIVVIDYGD